MVAKYPSAQILAQVCIFFFIILCHQISQFSIFQLRSSLVLQDLFTSGIIKSATDFQVYKEVAGLSGLDFAYADNTAVYHTKVLLKI